MYDKTVTFLAKAVTLIPLNLPDSTTIKSHLISKCRDSEYDKQVTLAKSSFGPNILCKKCGNPWNDTGKIRISKTNRFKHEKRLLKKEAHPNSKLNSIQNKIKKFHSQKLMTMCKFCKNCSFTEMKTNKLSQKTIAPVTNTPNSSLTTSTTPQTKKIKKRKKDLFAGLNKDIVRQSMTPKALKGKIPQVLSKTPKAIPKNNLNKLAKALNKESSPGSSIMKLLK